MTNPKVLKGVLLISLGATSYGMLATFVKLAYQEKYTTAEVTVAQFVLGIIGLLTIHWVQKHKKTNTAISGKSIFQLLLAGTSLGLTSVFYYLTVKYIPVSIAIVLLMQTVWMGVVLEWALEKKAPSIQKIIAVFIVLIGSILATNVLNNNLLLNWQGITFGLLAAISFTTTMFTANKIATNSSATQRSLYMLLGGFIIVCIFAIATQNAPFNFGIFTKWGIVLAIFGTIIPPLLLNAGFPYTGIGLGSIVSALELPVSILMAYFILQEKVFYWQWIGVLFILMAIVAMNIKINRKYLN